MKEVKEVIPIKTGRIVQHTTYICESCGNSHTNENLIEKCPMCGKDVCVNCECDNPLFDDNILASITSLNTSSFVCIHTDVAL